MDRLKQAPLFKKRGLRRYIGPKRLLLLGLLAGGVLLSWHLWKRDLLTPEAIFAFIAEYAVLAPLLFVAVYVLFTVFLMPSLPLCLGSGLLWGPLWGGVLSTGGAIGGTCLAFLLARSALGQPLAERFENRLVAGIQEEIDEKGWRAVALMCFNPTLPPGPLGYLFGLTSLRFRTFAATTGVCMLPQATVYAWVGHASGSFATQGDFLRFIQLIGAVAGALVLAVATRIVYRRMSAKRAAAETPPPGDPPGSP